jgi:hypothetical protein
MKVTEDFSFSLFFADYSQWATSAKSVPNQGITPGLHAIHVVKVGGTCSSSSQI